MAGRPPRTRTHAATTLVLGCSVRPTHTAGKPMGQDCPGWGLGKAMKYFVEGLPKKQIKVLKALGPQMAPKGFYLAGETALAIHYGHRISVDLDWFTPETFEDGMLLAQALRNSGLG